MAWVGVVILESIRDKIGIFCTKSERRSKFNILKWEFLNIKKYLQKFRKFRKISKLSPNYLDVEKFPFPFPFPLALVFVPSFIHSKNGTTALFITSGRAPVHLRCEENITVEDTRDKFLSFSVRAGGQNDVGLSGRKQLFHPHQLIPFYFQLTKTRCLFCINLEKLRIQMLVIQWKDTEWRCHDPS